MKAFMVALFGVGFCAATATGIWLSTPEPADGANTAAQLAAATPSERTASARQASGLWTWGNADAGKTDTRKTNKSLDVLLAQALRATNTSVESNDARNELRKLANEDPAVMKQLIQSYDKESNSQTRQLMVSLLSGLEKPEVLAFSKRLALSSDMAQRKDGFTMLQNLSGDVPEVHPIILRALTTDKTPEGIMLALAALKPPADAEGNAPQTNVLSKDGGAIVAQLQNLTRHADPNIRLQSILQLAQWDKTGSSQEQWSQALADQSPQVRQAAVTAVAQSGTKSDIVKAALLGMANNQNESKDVRGNALQVLESFTLSKDEAANLGQLRSQILGL
ncbi:MAG: HEAT repeat domain-containing protein [Burkholderiales bacterium]|nr:HEAT repeat domain-containing protein [Burkholderiales bacterium]